MTASNGAGWDFLDAQWDALYPGDPDTLVFPSFVGGDCKQVIAWPAPGHWHLVTYGLTELTEKVSSIAEQDGWGFELTMRVPTGSDVQAAVVLLASMVEHVYETARPFGIDHWLPWRHGFGDGSTLAGATFVEDPSLPPRIGPVGRVAFRQVVGLTHDELETVMATSDGRVVAALRARDPWLITDPRRRSIFDDAGAPERAEPTPLQRSGPELLVEVLRVVRSFSGQRECHVGSLEAGAIADAMIARLPARHSLEVMSDAVRVRFRSGDTSSARFEVEGFVDVTLAPDALDGLVAALRAGTNRAIALPDLGELAFRVVDL
jgi:suppressor of fused-like protein